MAEAEKDDFIDNLLKDVLTTTDKDDDDDTEGLEPVEPDPTPDSDPDPVEAKEIEPTPNVEDPKPTLEEQSAVEEIEAKPEGVPDPVSPELAALDTKPPAVQDGATLAKENAGLRRELQKLRNQNRLAQPAPVVPVPPADVQPVGDHPGRIPVMLSDDGQQVYVDQSVVDSLISQGIAQSRQPTQRDLVLQRNAEQVQQFIAEDPGNREVVNRAQEADDFITLNIENLMAQGVVFSSQADVIQHLEAAGIDKKISEFTPEIGSAVSFAEFIAARSSGDAVLGKALLQRMRGNGAAADPAPNPPVPPALEDVSGAPRALARKGGARSEPPGEDKREFDALQARFSANPFNGVSEAEYTRLEELGRNLRIEGWEAS